MFLSEWKLLLLFSNAQRQRKKLIPPNVNESFNEFLDVIDNK